MAAHFLDEARWTENERVLYTGHAILVYVACTSKHFRLSLASMGVVTPGRESKVLYLPDRCPLSRDYPSKYSSSRE